MLLADINSHVDIIHLAGRRQKNATIFMNHDQSEYK